MWLQKPLNLVSNLTDAIMRFKANMFNFGDFFQMFSISKKKGDIEMGNLTGRTYPIWRQLFFAEASLSHIPTRLKLFFDTTNAPFICLFCSPNCSPIIAKSYEHDEKKNDSNNYEEMNKVKTYNFKPQTFCVFLLTAVDEPASAILVRSILPHWTNILFENIYSHIQRHIVGRVDIVEYTKKLFTSPYGNESCQILYKRMRLLTIDPERPWK